MSNFKEPRISYNDQPNGRAVTVNLNHLAYPNVTISFTDAERPDETNAQERARILSIAKGLLREAGDSL